jgi:hypothetical protein
MWDEITSTKVNLAKRIIHPLGFRAPHIFLKQTAKKYFSHSTQDI